jgi:hypothetical protein
MITSRKELANKLSQGAVSLSQVSVKLERIVALWIARKEIRQENNVLILN